MILRCARISGVAVVSKQAQKKSKSTQSTSPHTLLGHGFPTSASCAHTHHPHPKAGMEGVSSQQPRQGKRACRSKSSVPWGTSALLQMQKEEFELDQHSRAVFSRWWDASLCSKRSCFPIRPTEDTVLTMPPVPRLASRSPEFRKYCARWCPEPFPAGNSQMQGLGNVNTKGYKAFAWGGGFHPGCA